jgi:hypothetical protein
MNNMSVTVMRSAENTSIWVAKCYLDGIIETVQTFPTAKQAQDWAADWLADQADNISENN